LIRLKTIKKPKLDNRIKLKPFKRKQQNKRKLDIETDDDDDHVADGENYLNIQYM
jgi:hypothetical protein